MNAQADILPLPAVEKTLPNGLKVIVVPTGFPNIVSLQIPVQTGSRNEVEPGKSGFAHFFEHMMFRGTKAYPPEKYQAVMTRAGARTNAYTSDDYTNYHATFAKEDLAQILEMEADRFQNLAYSEEDFKTEARAVLGEYNKNSASPVNKLIEVQRDHAFTTHTYKHTTMGFLKDIEDMPNQFAYSKEFFDRWYRPEHVTIIVAGDVKAAEVFPLVEKHWGVWKRGTFSAKIPVEPPATGPVAAHVPWPSATLPYVSVAFHAPAFSETAKDWAAMDVLLTLSFGATSDLRKRLVDQEQKVDQMFAFAPASEDPSLATVGARVKKMEDALYVRDEILRTFRRAATELVPEKRLRDALASERYSLLRSLDNTEQIASTIAQFVHYRRSFATLNQLYRVYETLTPADLQRVAAAHFTDAGLVVTTLSKDPMPAAMAKPPSLASLGGGSALAELKLFTQPSALPQLNIKLLFGSGSAQDPVGKEGLARLTAAMVTDAGSKAMRMDEIRTALFPMAGGFSAQTDRELTTLTGVVHADNWPSFLDTVLPMLTDPGFREEDFRRIKDQQKSALLQDLRDNNEEELGKERLQANLFAGTPYGHPPLGSVAGLAAITLDDVRAFLRAHYTRANLRVGLSGNLPEGLTPRLRRDLAALPEGPAAAAPAGVAGKRPQGIEVEIVRKETRATAISFGHPIEVTRAHPDFAALSVARVWLGEHRSSQGRLFQRIREVRGMNYGDYAYIEAFPRGMFQFFPEPNVARRAQLFEIWIRPVPPENAHMALRIAIHELQQLVEKGLTKEAFESTRGYLMKNVYLLTATQNQELGYRLDSDWYGIAPFVPYMREQLAKLTVDDVNRAIRKHLSPKDLSVVIITRDAEGLRDRLLADEPSVVKYDAAKPEELLAEDKTIGALKLGIRAGGVRITPVEDVFAR
jgi:zinc protease